MKESNDRDWPGKHSNNEVQQKIVIKFFGISFRKHLSQECNFLGASFTKSYFPGNFPMIFFGTLMNGCF